MAETPAPASGSETPVAAVSGEAAASVAAGTEPDMSAILAGLEADFPPGSPEAVAIGDKPPESAQSDEPAAEPKPADEPVGDDTPATAEVQAARRILATAARKERKALEAIPAAEAKLLKLFQDDPHAFLERAGTSIKDWLARVAAGADGAAPTEDDIAARTARLEAAAEARRVQDATAEVAEARRNVIAAVTEAATSFPLIAQEKAADKVPAKMIAYHKNYGKPCSIEHAAKLVEADLRASGKKLPTPARAPASAQPASSTRQASATMTNSETRGQPVTGELPDDPDSRYRAVLAELG